MTQHIATCRTGGCTNEGIGVEVSPKSNFVICGPCEVIITDVVPPIPLPEPESPADDAGLSS